MSETDVAKVIEELDEMGPGPAFDPIVKEGEEDQGGEGDFADDVEVAMMGDEQPVQLDPTRTGEIDPGVVIEDRRVPYVISLMEDVYGRGHRGAIAIQRMEMRDIIQVENALVYVSHKMSDTVASDCKSFFGGQPSAPYHEVPDELVTVAGGLHITMTAVLMRDHAAKAKLFIDPVKGLHGRIHKGKCTEPEEAWEWVQKLFPGLCPTGVEKMFPLAHPAVWDFDSFVKLYAVVQLNAVEGIVPLSINMYGLGFFPGSVYFNHSCSPNAMRVMMPGKLCIQVTADINPGDEITVAYREVPSDLVAESVSRRLHYDVGLYDGCRCKVCSVVDKEQEKEREEGADNVVEVDNLEHMWTENTGMRLALDTRLKSLVTSVIRGFAHEEGASAVSGLRQFYSHYFTRATGPEDYCPDLALVVGELYCTATIHVHNQYPEDLLFWPKVYMEAIRASQVQLPLAMSTALTACAYGAVMAVGGRHPDDKANHASDTNKFVMAWVALRSLHAQLHGHLAYLMLPLKSHAILGNLTTVFAKTISGMEQSIALHEEQQTALAAQREREEVEAAIKAEKEEEQHQSLSASSATVPIEQGEPDEEEELHDSDFE